MIRIRFSSRAFIKDESGKVAVRVRWNSQKTIVDFITGVYAEKTKWDTAMQKAKKGTTHHMGSHDFTASEINQCVAEFKEAIQNCFEECSIRNTIPTADEFKKMVNAELGRNEEIAGDNLEQKKTLKQLFDEFLIDGERRDNWDRKCKEKYNQAYQHITSANPNLTLRGITIDAMYRLKDWYVANDYKNRTINKQIIMLKRFLKFINQQDGYSIPEAVLNFETNLKVLKRSVSFLHYNELIHFANFEFEEDTIRLSHARDLWCFMAFTSLRYSDLHSLKNGHIIDGSRIEKLAQKTGERLSIPLSENAKAILQKHQGEETADGYLFAVPSNQKLNDAIKDAARAAGLDRLFIDTYVVGTERKEEQHKFCDIISCHDARRTFVSCSLALGIPAQVVMKCTGHSCYNTMKPYIETATETQALEMERWNQNQYKSRIINLLSQRSEEELKEIEAAIIAKYTV